MPSSAWSSDVCSSDRSEEHTSELQSQSNLVCRLLLAKKHTSELQSQSNLVCRLLLEKKKSRRTQARRPRSPARPAASPYRLRTHTWTAPRSEAHLR